MTYTKSKTLMKKMSRILTINKFDCNYMLIFIIKCQLRNGAQLVFQLILKFCSPALPTSFIML